MTIYEKIIKVLKEKGMQVSTMESCTGGALASEITNQPGASEVFLYGAVTYSNEYKIKMGVDENVINKYSVYSIETAIEMAQKIALFTNSDYGIGVTGKINNPDINNLSGKDNEVFIAIYERVNNKIYKFNAINSRFLYGNFAEKTNKYLLL